MRIFLLIFITLIPLSVNADNYSDYQLRRLFAPTVSESAAESRGIVHIYDGLNSVQVDDALNKHFERMDNMMFTQIVRTGEDGQQYVEEDGCD